MQSCRECHADKYASFIETGMGKSFGLATMQKTSARFNSQAQADDHFRNLHYHPFWQLDSLYLLEFRLEGKDTIYRRREHIRYIVGSGQHTNSHILDVNGYLFQAPATFYTQSGKWDLPPGFENGFNSRFSRKIGLECMTCHNAYPEFVEGSENKFAKIPLGIDCERCHGPGSAHVALKKSGQLVDINKEIDYSIVNPAKLPVNLQLDVCQRCHVQGDAVLKNGKSFFDFKPGMPLTDVMDIYMPVFKGREEEHIMASHAERLKMSRCFIESAKQAATLSGSSIPFKPYMNSLTCVTCHDPHISVRSTGKELFNARCVKCHSHSGNAVTANDCSLPLKDRIASGNNCTGCHMPGGGTVDIPHVMNTDHYIRIPVSRKKVNEIREFVTLAAVNNPNPDSVSRGRAFISYYEKFSSKKEFLDSALNYFEHESPQQVKKNISDLIRISFLKNKYSEVLRYAELAQLSVSTFAKRSWSNDDAWTNYRIAESFMNTGDPVLAIAFFKQATALAPYNPDFRNKLASAEMDIGNSDDAAKNFQFILRENPGYASAYVNYGFLTLSVDHDAILADSLYDRALALDPDNEQAMLNKAGVKIYLKQNAKARTILQKILRKNPTNQTARAVLEKIRKN